MEDEMIHWGIIGAGSIARKFAADLNTIPNAKLYAIASRTLDKAKDFGQDLSG
jgi:predicted dehydrogenase